MKNKKGAAMLVWVIVFALIVVAAFIIVPKLQSGADKGEVGGVDIRCNDDPPYVENATYNDYLRGTSVGLTYQYVMVDDSGNPMKDSNGGLIPAKSLTVGSSGDKFNVGDKLKIFSTKTAFLDRVDDFEITKCGKNLFTNYISGADGGSIDILTKGYVAVTDAVDGAVNITNGGSAVNLDAILEVKGVQDEDTGQLYITIEGNDTEVDDINLYAKSGSAKVIDDNAPIYDLFVAEGTSPTIKRAFIIDSVKDGDTVEYTITFVPETGVTMGAAATSGFVYVNAYAGQWFVDDDGSLQFGWEDSDGTAKYETAFTDHDALIS